MIPVLNFQFLGLPELFAVLSQPDNYSGLILSSPRAVEALSLAVKSQETGTTPCIKMSFFASGEFVVQTQAIFFLFKWIMDLFGHYRTLRLFTAVVIQLTLTGVFSSNAEQSIIHIDKGIFVFLLLTFLQSGGSGWWRFGMLNPFTR